MIDDNWQWSTIIDDDNWWLTMIDEDRRWSVMNKYDQQWLIMIHCNIGTCQGKISSLSYAEFTF